MLQGGISQGGMVAIHAALRGCPEIAGCIVVSATIPQEEAVLEVSFQCIHLRHCIHCILYLCTNR